MNNKDLAAHIAETQALGPATYAGDQTSAAADLQNYMSAAVLLSVGVGGITFDATNKIEFVLTHSDDDSTYTAVGEDDLNGTDAPTTVTDGIIKALTAAHAAAAVYEFGYIGGKRYLKLQADFSGTHGTGTPISAVIVKGHPRILPAN